MTTSTIICDALQTPADFTTNLFSRQREDSFHMPNNAVTEEAMLRLKSQKSSRSLRTISSHGLRRRSNLSHGSNQVSNQKGSEPNVTDEPESFYEGTGPLSFENDEFQKSKESRALDSPALSTPGSSSPHSRKKNTISTSVQPVDIPEKLSASPRPSLSIYTGSSRKNTYPSHFNPFSQSPITPSDYTFSKKKHESLSTSCLESPSTYFSGSRSLAKAVIIENLQDANEIIHAFLLEILIRKQVTDRSTVYNLSNPFIVVVLLPIAFTKHNLPNQLLDRFFISYTYEAISISGAGKSSTIPTRRILIKSSDIEDLSRKMDNVTIHNDMHRYIRDVVVGIRTHRLVKGGLTARASSDLVILIKALAAVFQRNYVTPELVLFASEKIFSHRLTLRDAGDDKSTMYGTSLMTLLRARNLAAKFPSPSEVVADVLQVVWPPV